MLLRFSTTETTEPERTLQLSAEQAARIREMTVITSSLMMSLTVDESDLSVHLVGRKSINGNGLARVCMA